ncbi:OB-fold domain-containing protein [Hoeflea sp. WL0058]|uniref:OB-fold domain-containing protein n=1 Tax=Flavimaribacter sediminis TaxID=2865987 RepID=A0AAE3CZZ7_9HYPH|nr:OB-fold domain-containing protein [Flavimaribacter sediminis]MBW8636246.1 OB-fold domain-containing protein [Flavimaribacter sediminis]
MLPHRLSTEGFLYTWTVVHVPSALGHKPPYAYGYINLPADGTRIFAPLVADSETVWKPSLSVSLIFVESPARETPGVLSYAFTPTRRVDDV